MRIPIYLATQTFKDGRVMYRRCTTAAVEPRFIPGGVYASKTPAATAWLQQANTPTWESWPDFAGLEPFEWVET